MNNKYYNVQTMNNKEKEDSLTLELLETIESQSNVTQRHLANRLGVALGLINSYLKKCVHKGLVKIHQVPANRYLYFLTPEGFAEKSRLTASYLSRSFDFYRQASDSLTYIYKECKEKNRHKVLFCGVSELAEIASIRAHEHDIRIIGTFDPDSEQKQFLRLPVWRTLEDVDNYDACLLTSLNDTKNMYELLTRQIDKDLVLVPSILGLDIQDNTRK